jgi:hypothetical protein
VFGSISLIFLSHAKHTIKFEQLLIIYLFIVKAKIETVEVVTGNTPELVPAIKSEKFLPSN